MADSPNTDRHAIDLRARNLAENRRRVAAVALRLFAEHGFDAVTIDDIAAEAGMSRRTFFRYFDSKEDAALPYEDERLERFRDLLAERPPDEAVMATVRRCIRTLLSAEWSDPVARQETVARLTLIHDTPSVHAHSLALRTSWELAVRDVIAEHLGVDPETSLVANVTASAALGAVRSAGDVWLAAGCSTDLVELVDDAFDVLATGLGSDHGRG